jgi:hypothetical protein
VVGRLEGVTPVRGVAAVTAVYATAVAAVLPARPLWMDEVIQLWVSRLPSAGEVIAAVPTSAGAVPLGILAQHYVIELAGLSEVTARLVAALFGIASVFVTGLIAWRLGLRRPWIAAALFALFPLTLRYSAEGRVYSQGVFFSALATLVFVRLVGRTPWSARDPQVPQRPTGASAAGKGARPTAVTYAAIVAACAYSQPLSMVVAGAHCGWAALERKWRLAVWSAGAAAAAGLLFLPWALWARAGWKASAIYAETHFVFTAKTPLMLFRELCGAGYWGSGLLLILAVVAVRRVERPVVVFLGLLIAVPLAAGLAADAASNYFIAIRQFLWVLPAIAILAAFGVERGGRTGVLLAALLAAGCAWSSVRYFTAPAEDWQAAAGVLRTEMRAGACVSVTPVKFSHLYRFFAPELKTGEGCAKVAAAVAPYARAEDREGLLQRMAGAGYSLVRTERAGGSTVFVFRR